MIMTALGRAVRPRRILWRDLLVTLAAVATIIVGLLAMHSLNLEEGDGASLIASAAPTAHHVAMLGSEGPGGAEGSADGCGGVPCSPDHSMTAMACVLALLVLVLLLGTIRVVTAWAPARVRVAEHDEPRSSLPRPNPPSLDALCISRT